MYHLSTIHFVTDRQTDIMMTMADHIEIME